MTVKDILALDILHMKWNKSNTQTIRHSIIIIIKILQVEESFNSLTTVGYLLGVFFKLWIPFLVRISTSARS